MARALDSVLSGDAQPRVLDLGQAQGAAALYLANRGARVVVDELDAQDDGAFDLVLGWEHADFTPPDELDGLFAGIERVLAPGGWLVLYARDAPGEAGVPAEPARYCLRADDRMLREPSDGASRSRWSHPQRAIESALGGLRVQAVHRQVDSMREMVARKPLA